ncbi:MAG: Hint domain-containing protein [Paracoccaceae bacterium]
MSDPSSTPRAYAAHAFPADAIRVTAGANLRDPIAEAELCEAGDFYRLDPQARALRLMLEPVPEGKRRQLLADGSEIGAPGDEIALLSLLTLMAPDGDKVDILFTRHAPSGAGFAIPLSPMASRIDYALIELSDDVGDIRITDIVCVSFAAGTLITMPGGDQRPIETLRAGQSVLTRDHGSQEIRWIGKATLRAKGSFAPVVISAGTLGNNADLVVSPHHRVFIYQRGLKRLGTTAELLVQARHLVDDDRVQRREGGFVDYYSLVFDRHEIIYAEGIPAESLMVNEATVSHLPPELAAEVKARFPGLSQTQHFGTEAGRELLDEAARDQLLGRR